MSANEQVFKESEGDAWFKRNSEWIMDTSKSDWPFQLIQALHIKPNSLGSVTEVGCANGFRLWKLRQIFPKTVLHGIEPSYIAVEDGMKRFNDGGPSMVINLQRGMAHELNVHERSDIVILSFVLCWVGRNYLEDVIRRVDESIWPGGFVIVSDFCPDRPTVRPYHHRPGAFTYKEDYAQKFIDLGYSSVARVIYDETDGLVRHTIDPDCRAKCEVLMKPGNESRIAYGV